MNETIKIGLGFVTGRPNVCKVINNTYEQLINQFKDSDKKVELTIFILFDLGYQYTTREDFYEIIPNVYKNIIIRYITPEDIEEQKKKLEESKTELNNVKTSKESKQKQLSTAKTEKSKYAAKLSENEKTTQAELEQFEKDKQEITAQLKKIAEQEEAARRQHGNSGTTIISGNPSDSYGGNVLFISLSVHNGTSFDNDIFTLKRISLYS